MHEYPITQHIIEMAEDHCEKAGGTRVKTIHLVCGERSGYIPESIQMYFEIIAEGTCCEGGSIDIRSIPSKMYCPHCDKLFARKPMSFACPTCGRDGEPSEVGKEFYIDSIEVE